MKITVKDLKRNLEGYDDELEITILTLDKPTDEKAIAHNIIDFNQYDDYELFIFTEKK